MRSGEIGLKAKVKEYPHDDPCCLNPESKYRGRENQLYRIEIHQDGDAQHLLLPMELVATQLLILKILT